MRMGITALEEGRVEFSCELDESVYNPIGVVHGGLVCTLLDTVAGCAVHTTLPAGVGYTSIELKVNYLRAVHATSGPLTAIGRVVKPGRRVAFAEGEVLDAAGRTVATASSSLLVFPHPAGAGEVRPAAGGAAGSRPASARNHFGGERPARWYPSTRSQPRLVERIDGSWSSAPRPPAPGRVRARAPAWR